MINWHLSKLLTGAAALMFMGAAGAATTSNVVVLPTLPFTDPSYLPNGSIRTTVTDTPDCTSGLFQVSAAPIPGSSPGGSNPPNTTVTAYIGFPAGNVFFFENAGFGQYTITTTTMSCSVGTAPAPIVDVITIAPAPTIASVLPATGSTAGGTSVVISGSNFTGATAVTFGVNAATSFTVDSDSQITAVTAAGAAGIVSVAVTAPGGTVATGTFTYTQPVAAQITSVPTLSEWAMIIMASLMALFAIRKVRRN